MQLIQHHFAIYLFLTDGKIQFLGDCFHDLKNQTVDMVDISEPEIWIE